jgi:NifU-like protein involved in Fe-S cluster formation
MTRYRNPVYRDDVSGFLQEYRELPGIIVVSASGDNPLCGDTLRIGISVDADLRTVNQACYEGYGCSLCIASAEALLESLKGKSVDACLAMSVNELLASLGDVVVSRTRMKCIELPLLVLKKALNSFR